MAKTPTIISLRHARFFFKKLKNSKDVATQHQKNERLLGPLCVYLPTPKEKIRVFKKNPRAHLMQIVYKIIPEKEWQEACKKGIYYGSEHDLRDGFIHLSTSEQLEDTAKRFFKNQKGLLLVAFGAKALGAKLCFEPSSHGGMFPHYYADLPTHLAMWSKQMFLGEDLIPRVCMETK